MFPFPDSVMDCPDYGIARQQVKSLHETSICICNRLMKATEVLRSRVLFAYPRGCFEGSGAPAPQGSRNHTPEEE